MKDKLPVVGQRYKDKSGLVFKLKGHSSIHLDHPDWWMEFCFEEMKISCPLKYFFEQFEELPNSNPQEEHQDEIDKMYQLEVDIIRLESDLNIKKAMLRIMERNRVNKTPNPVDLKKGEVSEVDRALEELREGIHACEESASHYSIMQKPGPVDSVQEARLYKQLAILLKGKAKNLINALEAEKANRHNKACDTPESDVSKPEPEIDMKEERVEPVSIWKDVSELPYNYAKVILKIKAGTNYYLGAFFKDGEFYDEELSDFENLPIRKDAIWKWCFKNDPLKTLEQIQKDIEELKKK